MSILYILRLLRFKFVLNLFYNMSSTLNRFNFYMFRVRLSNRNVGIG